MVEGCLVLNICDAGEYDDLVDFHSLSEYHSSRIEIVGGRVAAYASVEEVVLRKVGRDPADIAVAPRERAFCEGIAQHQDAGTSIGKRNLPDLLVAKAEAIGEELIRILTPVLD